MIAQHLKDVYFACNSWLVLPNTWLTRLVRRSHRDLILHLGCGDDYRAGMVNVDGNLRRKKDLWLDLRNRLPFADGSARVIYCCHVLEHLLPGHAMRLLQEMRRILAPSGVVRLAVPSFEHCLQIANGDRSSDWPRSYQDPLSQAINYLFCDGQHKYAYCFETLQHFATEAGFTRVVNYSATRGVDPQDYHGIELGREPTGSLVVELYSG